MNKTTLAIVSIMVSGTFCALIVYVPLKQEDYRKREELRKVSADLTAIRARHEKTEEEMRKLSSDIGDCRTASEKTEDELVGVAAGLSSCREELAAARHEAEEANRELAATTMSAPSDSGNMAEVEVDADLPPEVASIEEPSPRPALAYEVLVEETQDGPAKSQVEMRILVKGHATRVNLRSLMVDLFEKCQRATGFQFRTHPNAVYIYAYMSKEQYASSGIGWIAALNWNVNVGDIEPNVRVDTGQLDALQAEIEVKFGLTVDQRKRVYWELVAAEDEASKTAEQREPLTLSPATTAGREQIMRYASLEDSISKRLKSLVLERYGLTDEQRNEIELEGLVKSWPMP